MQFSGYQYTVRIAGNEAGDLLAKRGSNLLQQKISNLPFISIKRVKNIKKHMQELNNKATDENGVLSLTNQKLFLKCHVKLQ